MALARFHVVGTALAVSFAIAASPASAAEPTPRETHLRYLHAAAEVPGDALSDLLVAHRLWETLRYTLGPTPAEAALLEQLKRDLATLDERARASIDKDPALIAVRLGPLWRDRDDDARDWQSTLQRLVEARNDNAFESFVVFRFVHREGADWDWVPAVVEGGKRTGYDDHAISAMRAMRARLDSIPAAAASAELARRPNVVEKLATDVFPDPLWAHIAIAERCGDLTGMHPGGSLAQSPGAAHGKAITVADAIAGCRGLYGAMLDGARDMRSLELAAIVLGKIGDEAGQEAARRASTGHAWFAHQFGRILLDEENGLGPKFLDRLIDQGQLAAYEAEFRARGIPIEPPPGWTAPDP